VNDKERAQRAQALKDDPFVQEVLAKMERQALDDFVGATRWWWGDRRRRIAAEHFREVCEFKRRLDAAVRSAPIERIRSIA
jgi:hypothetical protein